MPDSIEEQLVQAVVSQLGDISLSNGYANAIPSIQRFEQEAQDFVDVPMLLVQWGEVNFDRRIGPSSVWELGTILVAVYTRHTKALDARSTDAILIALDADIYRAVMQDRTLGGLAIDTFRASVFPDDLKMAVPMVGHISEFTVKYAHRDAELIQ